MQKFVSSQYLVNCILTFKLQKLWSQLSLLWHFSKLLYQSWSQHHCELV